MSLVNINDTVISPKSITFENGLTVSSATNPPAFQYAPPIVTDVATAVPISSGTPYQLFSIANFPDPTHSYLVMISISVSCVIPSGKDGAGSMNIKYYTGSLFNIEIPRLEYYWESDGANIQTDGVNTSFIVCPSDLTNDTFRIMIDLDNVGGTYTIPDALGLQVVTLVDLGERDLTTESSGFPPKPSQPSPIDVPLTSRVMTVEGSSIGIIDVPLPSRVMYGQ
jgi:hypothetical protein